MLVDREAPHVDAINRRGLLVDGVRGPFRQRVAARTPDRVEWSFDLVFLAVKCVHTEGALTRLLPHLVPEGAVASVLFASALADAPVHEIVHRPEAAGLLFRLGQESAAVPLARGIRLERLVDLVHDLESGRRSMGWDTLSMLDLDRQRVGEDC